MEYKEMYKKTQQRFNELMDRDHEISMIFCLDQPDEEEQERLNEERKEIKQELKGYGLGF